jgi:NAD(P)H-flavin reductase
MNNNNPYSIIRTEVLDVITETPTIKTLRLRPAVPVSFETGQFMELTLPGIGEAPFTPSSKPSVKEEIQLSIMRVGKITQKVHELQPGAVVGLRGPFGQGYPLEEFRDKEILVVGGGCGFAPLRSLMYAFFERSGQFKKLFFRGGCKNPHEFLFRQEIEGWRQRNDLNMDLTVDKSDDPSWTGKVGLVTTILDGLEMDHGQGYAIVCGPPIMMKFATKKLLSLGFQESRILLSMEKNMSCGLGKCGHCRVGTYYACKDGPVLRYDRIKDFPEIWD